MNAILRTSSFVVLFAISGLCAAEPKVGKVLLIDNDRLLEGDIEQTQKHFRIRGNVGEMSIPVGPNMLLLPSKEAAYTHLRAQARLADPLERVRLARWCLSNNLMPQAVTEAEAALTLRPEDRSLQQFVEMMKRRAELAPPPPVATQAPLTPVTHETTTTADVNPESFSLFVTKIQPLLLNACGQCHMNDRGGKFNLVPTVSGFGDKRATQLNLIAASEFLDRGQLSNSPLLTRAVTVHGFAARPPILNRQVNAYKHLEQWAQLATGRLLTAPAPAPLPEAAVAVSQPLTPESPRPTPDSNVTPAIAIQPMRPTPPVTAPTTTDDPFDPEVFNRQNTPPKK